MTIIMTHGDMFKSHFDYRVNTVNCVGVMGKGIALQFKNKYPDMFKRYKNDCNKGLIRPGVINAYYGIGIAANEYDCIIINFPTKRHWRENSRLEDIEAGLSSLKHYLSPLGDVKVALPPLGCSNGGLNWDDVFPLICKYLGPIEARIFVYAPKGV